jgi:hypothetical protein
VNNTDIEWSMGVTILALVALVVFAVALLIVWAR